MMVKWLIVYGDRIGTALIGVFCLVWVYSSTGELLNRSGAAPENRELLEWAPPPRIPQSFAYHPNNLPPFDVWARQHARAHVGRPEPDDLGIDDWLQRRLLGVRSRPYNPVDRAWTPTATRIWNPRPDANLAPPPPPPPPSNKPVQLIANVQAAQDLQVKPVTGGMILRWQPPELTLQPTDNVALAGTGNDQCFLRQCNTVITRSSASADSASFEQIAVVPSSVTQYHDSTVDPETDYTYRLQTTAQLYRHGRIDGTQYRLHPDDALQHDYVDQPLPREREQRGEGVDSGYWQVRTGASGAVEARSLNDIRITFLRPIEIAGQRMADFEIARYDGRTGDWETIEANGLKAGQKIEARMTGWEPGIGPWVKTTETPYELIAVESAIEKEDVVTRVLDRTETGDWHYRDETRVVEREVHFVRVRDRRSGEVFRLGEGRSMGAEEPPAATGTDDAPADEASAGDQEETSPVTGSRRRTGADR